MSHPHQSISKIVKSFKPSDIMYYAVGFDPQAIPVDNDGIGAVAEIPDDKNELHCLIPMQCTPGYDIKNPKYTSDNKLSPAALAEITTKTNNKLFAVVHEAVRVSKIEDNDQYRFEICVQCPHVTNTMCLMGYGPKEFIVNESALLNKDLEPLVIMHHMPIHVGSLGEYHDLFIIKKAANNPTVLPEDK